jgi:hypothetical protein
MTKTARNRRLDHEVNFMIDAEEGGANLVINAEEGGRGHDQRGVTRVGWGEQWARLLAVSRARLS